MDKILDNILRALDFHFSPLSYLEERELRFVDVTDNQDLIIEPVDNGQPITDSEDEKMRKQNKRAAKKKARLDNLRAPVRAPAAGSAAFLLSRPESSTRLSLFLARPGTPTALSSRFMPAPISRSPAVLSLLSVLSQSPPHLASTALRTFKRALSAEALRRSTSLAKPLCPFLPLSSLLDKTKCKRIFDTAFINSCPLADNHS